MAQQPASVEQTPAGKQVPVDDSLSTKPGRVELGAPPTEQDLPVLPINLATALQLSSSRPIDVELASERIRAAVSVLEQANALWLPTITIGGDYNRHDGQIQQVNGPVIDASKSSAMLGLGSGFGSAALFSLNDAIFIPLAARQSLRARNSDAQAAANDSMLLVTSSYFNVEQSRGELAAALDATHRTQEVYRRVKSLSSGLIAPLEVVRAEADLARRQEAEVSARERWQVFGSELARLLRLDSNAQIEPLEPPHLQITIVEPDRTVDDLIALALLNRPELSSQQAQVQATLALLRQERLRPLVPSVLLRGASTPVTGTLGAGFFGGGTGSSIGNSGLREDFDIQLLWQLDNLGFGNRARARVRESEHRQAILELFRTQDRVAAEVAQASMQVRQARRRIAIAEQQVKLAIDSYNKNLVGLGQIRRAGELVQTIVRPQEVLASVEDLSRAYANYYRAVADFNRAQFRLYRAMGQPAQSLERELGDPGSPVPPAPAVTDSHAADAGAASESTAVQNITRDSSAGSASVGDAALN